MSQVNVGAAIRTALTWVLGIICVLVIAAIFWPVFPGGGHRAAKKTACLSNVKQQGVGMAIYTSDYDDRYPQRDDWIDALQPYTKNEDMYHCPTFWTDAKNPQIYGYCFSAKLSLAKVPVKDAETIPVIFESINLARNASGTLDSLPSPGRHNQEDGHGYNNIGFADAHAKSIKTP